MISLLLHWVNLRISVNNKGIIRMHLGYNWLVTTKTLPINGFFVKQQATVSGHVHQSKLPFSLTLHLDKLISVLQLLSDIRYITL